MSEEKEMVSMRDFYEILEIERTATSAEIKKAYRKKAKQYHPDLHPGDDEAEHKFKEVNLAYEVLSDESKRRTYDVYGEEGIKNDFTSGGGGFSGGFGDIFGDLFDMFGGGFGANFSGGNQAKAPRDGAHIRYDLNLTFKEAVFGTEKDIQIRRTENCSHCHGTGAEDDTKIHTCETCGGSGQVRQSTASAFGRFMRVVPCDTCGGTGTVIEAPCKHCKGSGKETVNRTLHLRIPAGVDDQSVMTMAGEGHAGDNGGQAGTVYVYLHVEEDDIFTRRGNNLYVDIPIRYEDAVLGGTIQVPTLKEIIDYDIPAGTQSGKDFRIQGEGVPFLRRKGAGDLIFTVKILVPTKVSDEERELLEQLRSEIGNKKTEQEKGFLQKLKDFFE